MLARIVRGLGRSVAKHSSPTLRCTTHQNRRLHNPSLSVTPIQAFLEKSLLGAQTSQDKSVLTLNFEEVGSLNFPSIWLRDNCRCDECFDHIANSRLIDQQVFRSDSIPTSIKVDSESLKVVWDDGHRSEFDKKWICNHSFEPQHQRDREATFHEPRLPWNAKTFHQIFQTFPYDKVMTSDETLLKWLTALARYGVSMVKDAPKDDSTVQQLASRVAFIRRTLYGEVFYVKSQEGATNTAYKKGQLQMHSDMPFYRYLPGTILLHCMVQSKTGGENLLTDGISVAQQLPRHHYEALANTVINWSDIGSDRKFHFHSINREPCICEDKLGNIVKINWSQPQRDARFDVPVSDAIAWYHAMHDYARLLHHPDNSVTLKMESGDILTIDNRRLMHSRANYSDGARQLNGAYIDWDEIYPKIRVLRQKVPTIS